MKSLITIFLILANLLCSAQGSSIDINLINGKWELPCDAPLADPTAWDCPLMDGYEEFTIDTKTGLGKTTADFGELGTMEFDVKVFEEDKKPYIEIKNSVINMKGLIVVLTDKEFAFVVNNEYTRRFVRP